VIRHYRYARAWLIDHFDAGAGAGAGTEPLADA
jgi:hypothetical protein